MRLLDGARTGEPGPAALSAAVRAVDPLRCPPGARQAAHELESGRPAADVLRDWQQQCGGTPERLLATALLVTNRNGGSLTTSIATAVALAHDAAALDARRRALLAPARATTVVLVLLPFLFAGFASLLNGGLIYRGPVGAALLVTGGSLDLVGLLWMRRLQARFGR